MSLALVLLVAAVLLATVAPRVLDSVGRGAIHPAVALVSWLSAGVAVLVFAATALLMLLGPEHPPVEQAADTVLRCLSAAHHNSRPWVGNTMAILTGMAAAAALGRAALCSHRHGTVLRRVQRRHRDTLALVARRGGERDVLRLEHSMPLAYAVGGRPGFVVLTDGMCALLTSGEREAVLAHERAHLRGRHHRIVAWCDVLAMALPFVPLFARAPRAVRTLLELLADQHAAQATSTAAVRSALAAVTASGSAPGPEWSLGGGTDTELRITNLNAAPQRSRGIACLSAVAATLALPAVAALGVVSIASVSTCLLLS